MILICGSRAYVRRIRTLASSGTVLVRGVIFRPLSLTAASGSSPRAARPSTSSSDCLSSAILSAK